LSRWNEKTEETENDSLALTLSFMIVQALRVLVSGVMPDPEGLEERHGPAGTGPLKTTHSMSEFAQLVLLGFMVFAAVMAWKDWPALAVIKDPIEDLYEGLGMNFERMTEVVADTGSMVLAWTFFFATYWFLDSINQSVCQTSGSGSINCGSGGMTGGVLLAMCITVFSYSTMFLVRRTALHIDDFAFSSHHQYKTAHDIILSIMKAEGLLIGFGWEKAFDKAVEDLSGEAKFPGLTRLVLSSWVFAVVGFIWMKYILPTVMEYEEDDDTKKDLKKGFKVRPKHAKNAQLLDKQNKRIEEAKEDFEEELKRIQEEFANLVKTTNENMQQLNCKDYKDEHDEFGRLINTGKIRADHLNHMRHLLRLQKEAAEYKIAGGSLFRLQRGETQEHPQQQRIAAAPYLQSRA